MTAIHLPPSSPSGLSGDSSALKAQLSANKLAALLPTGSTAGAGIRPSDGTVTPGTVATPRPAVPGAAQNGTATTSTRETLSFTARTILGLMQDAGKGAPQQARPLLPLRPTSASFISNAGPPALTSLVEHSGLFYESHVAQWVRGERPLQALLREPQARLTPSRMPVAQPGTAARPGAGGNTVGSASPFPPADLSGAGLPAMPSRPGAADADRQMSMVIDVPVIEAGPLPDAADGLVPQGSPEGDADSAGPPPSATAAPRPDTSAPTAADSAPRTQQLAAQAYAQAAEQPGDGKAQHTGTDAAADRFDGARSDGSPSPQAVHPATEGIVRQQLELLATQQFRWAGEAWPGAAMQWEIAQDEGRGQAAEDTGQRSWSSRVVLELPQLGLVEARLTLTPQGLETRLTAIDTLAASRLQNGQERLRDSLGARGIGLLHFSVITEAEARRAGEST